MRAKPTGVRFVSASIPMRLSLHGRSGVGNMTVAMPTTIRSASWCIDSDTRDNVIARRNVLAGLWAGRLLGLADADLTAYAVEVHLADFEIDGDADIVRKMTEDLSGGGVPR